MDSKKGVKSLWDIAADVVCKSTISKISVIFKGEKTTGTGDDSSVSETDSPPGKKLKLEESLFDVKQRKMQINLALINFRKELDYYLVNRFWEVRHRIVETFINIHNSHNQSEEKLDLDLVSAFFNCLLNDSFTTFDLTGGDDEHPFRLIDPMKLIGALNDHCPNLQTLKLSFGTKTNPVDFVPSFGSLLQHFKKLATLSLTWIHRIGVAYCGNSYSFEYFFASLGMLMPSLTSLEICGTIPFGIKELLNLMFGNKEDYIDKGTRIIMCSSKNQGLAHMQFTSASLTPLCNRLTELKVNLCHKRQYRLVAILTFVLRNFRQLQNFPQSPLFTCLMLKKLRERQLASLDTFTPKNESRGAVQWTSDAPFIGSLNLDTIKVSIVNRASMELIPILCPDLKRVHFVGDKIVHNDNLSSQAVRFLITQPINSPPNCWANVEDIKMTKVLPEYRQVVLECLGGGEKMKKLTLVKCDNVRPDIELLPCNQLEVLKIQQGSFSLIFVPAAGLPPHPIVIADLAEVFLPKLVSLVIDGPCLFHWFNLFVSSRPSLAQLSVTCLHISTGIGLNGWNHLSELFPNLQQLTFYNCGRWTLKMIRSIAPFLGQFQQLKELRLPTKFSCRFQSPKSSLEALAETGFSLPPGLRVETYDRSGDAASCPQP